MIVKVFLASLLATTLATHAFAEVKKTSRKPAHTAMRYVCGGDFDANTRLGENESWHLKISPANHLIYKDKDHPDGVVFKDYMPTGIPMYEFAGDFQGNTDEIHSWRVEAQNGKMKNRIVVIPTLASCRRKNGTVFDYTVVMMQDDGYSDILRSGCCRGADTDPVDW